MPLNRFVASKYIGPINGGLTNVYSVIGAIYGMSIKMMLNYNFLVNIWSVMYMICNCDVHFFSLPSSPRSNVWFVIVIFGVKDTKNGIWLWFDIKEKTKSTFAHMRFTIRDCDRNWSHACDFKSVAISHWAGQAIKTFSIKYNIII